MAFLTCIPRLGTRPCILVVDAHTRVLHGAVDGELATALAYTPLDDLAIAEHVPYLHPKMNYINLH